MFERRLKIFLVVLLLVSFALVLRAAQVQVVQHGQWSRRAAETMKRTQFVETIRGQILDFRGRPVAVDEPCVNACVDYRVVTDEPDATWVREFARKRLRERPGSGYLQAGPKRQAEMRAAETERVKADIAAMWVRLAQIGSKPVDEIHEIRRSIQHRVEMRRKSVWLRSYELAKRKYEADRKTASEARWHDWLIQETTGGDAPEVADFEVVVAEQTEPHVILRHLSVEAQNELGKFLENYPGLVLMPGTFRHYPYREAGCHLVGRLSRVDREDLTRDRYRGKDEQREYWPNDLVGRTGIEALAEPALRGTRGRVEKVDGREVARQAPATGRDVRLTIDIELQQEIQRMFSAVQFKDKQGNVEETAPMHGSAVVIDIATGGVRAMASYPDFDLNQYDTLHRYLNDPDNIDKPLLNRATQSLLEPGSTVKPIVGLGAIADGLLTHTHGIECTGYLVIGGQRYGTGRCWVASKYVKTRGVEGVKHHPIPVPHEGHDGNPNGFLTFDDALERSCNVYFENVAHLLGLEGLSRWYERFGLGRPTGVGVAERAGLLPREYKENRRDFATWSAGIGQGPVWATPLQMANVSATIARDGVWARPRLVEAGLEPGEAGRVAGAPAVTGPDSVDLKLPPAALRAAKDGMVRVVNSPAGTGTYLHRDDVKIAGKTGTAQGSKQWVRLRSPDGKPLKDEKGRERREFLKLSTPADPNPLAPWYRGTGEQGTDTNHAWFIGYAPADNPTIAFAVLVEYGGSGGAAAAGVAANVLEACVEHGYLPVQPKPIEAAGADVQ